MKTTQRQYAQVLFDLTKGKDQKEIDAVVLDFAQELRRNRSLKMMDGIIEKFEEIYNQENGIVVVEVVSASELSEDQCQNISEFVKEKYGAKEVVLEKRIDEDVVGGLIVKVGDEVIDGSVSGKIMQLKKSLLK